MWAITFVALLQSTTIIDTANISPKHRSHTNSAITRSRHFFLSCANGRSSSESESEAAGFAGCGAAAAGANSPGAAGTAGAAGAAAPAPPDVPTSAPPAAASALSCAPTGALETAGALSAAADSVPPSDAGSTGFRGSSFAAGAAAVAAGADAGAAAAAGACCLAAGAAAAGAEPAGFSLPSAPFCRPLPATCTGLPAGAAALAAAGAALGLAGCAAAGLAAGLVLGLAPGLAAYFALFAMGASLSLELLPLLLLPLPLDPSLELLPELLLVVLFRLAAAGTPVFAADWSALAFAFGAALTTSLLAVLAAAAAAGLLPDAAFAAFAVSALAASALAGLVAGFAFVFAVFGAGSSSSETKTSGSLRFGGLRFLGALGLLGDAFGLACFASQASACSRVTSPCCIHLHRTAVCIKQTSRLALWHCNMQHHAQGWVASDALHAYSKRDLQHRRVKIWQRWVKHTICSQAHYPVAALTKKYRRWSMNLPHRVWVWSGQACRTQP